MDWFLTELAKIAKNYRWYYVAYNGQAEIEQLAYRIWREAGCPVGRHEEHWWRAEKEYRADKPIRGMIVHDGPRTQLGQSISPLQAVVHAQTGVVYSLADLVPLIEAESRLAPGEAREIDAACDAAATGHSLELRAKIKQALGLES